MGSCSSDHRTRDGGQERHKEDEEQHDRQHAVMRLIDNGDGTCRFETTGDGIIDSAAG